MFVAKASMRMAVVAILSLATIAESEAAPTGKIRGKVINSRTKEGIPGAVIVVEGLSMNATSDSRGEYFIINVPPGNYRLESNLIGFVKQTVKDVVVIASQTTAIDFILQESVIILEKSTVVTAPRDRLKQGVPANDQVMTAEQLKHAPGVSLVDFIDHMSGVTKKGGESHVRGGRKEEVALSYDGVELADIIGGYNVFELPANISTYALQEFQVKKSGMSAGEVSGVSGAIQITSKAATDSIEGHLEYFTDYFRTDILDGDSRNYDRLQFSLSGREELLSDKLLPLLGIDWFAGKLKYSLSASYERSDDYVSFDDYGMSQAQRLKPTHSILGLFSVTEHTSNGAETHLKLNWQATKQTKLTFGYHYSHNSYVPFDWRFRYTPGTASRAEQTSTITSFHLVHQFDTRTFAEFQLSRWQRDYLDTPSDPDVAGGRIYPGDIALYDQWESFEDYDGDRVYDAPEPFININQDTSWYWGEPFYTFGDAWSYYNTVTNDNRILTGVWPTPELEFGGFGWRAEGPRYSDWRGADSLANQQGNSSLYVDSILTDWNGNGVVDFYESEPFADLNGDGRWNANDYFNQDWDMNGNGRFDPELAANIEMDQPEPYIDGDRVIGEPFTDVNLNGFYDPGIDLWSPSNLPALNQDLNYNSAYDGPQSEWSGGLPFDDLNGNGVYDAPNGVYDLGEPYLDLNGNGSWDSQDGFLDSGYDQWAHYNESSTTEWTASLDVTRQFAREHELKTGISVKFDDLNYSDLQYPQIPYSGDDDGGPWPDRGAFRDFYHRRPIRGAFYLQDRMEYGAMMANLGLRYDFFIQSADLKSTASEGFGEEKSISGSQNKLSPRIGMSYPISTRAKVFFNYGHYYQLPQLSQMYQRATQATTAAGIIGNENLDFVKTIQYEVGVACKLSQDYVITLSGFYKDEFDKVNSTSESYGPIRRNEYANLDYGRTRGLEMQLDKGMSSYVAGYVNYTYMFAYGKSSSERSNYFDDFYGKAIPISEFPLDWDERHQVSLNLSLQIPATDQPELFGLPLPSNWGISALWRFGSGFPFTPDKDFPGIRLSVGEQPQKNSMRYPAHSELDIRAWKRVEVAGLNFVFDLWVENLFDQREVLHLHSTTGRSSTDSKPVGASYVYEGADLAADPLNLGPGRNVRLGIGVDF